MGTPARLLSSDGQECPSYRLRVAVLSWPVLNPFDPQQPSPPPKQVAVMPREDRDVMRHALMAQFIEPVTDVAVLDNGQAVRPGQRAAWRRRFRLARCQPIRPVTSPKTSQRDRPIGCERGVDYQWMAAVEMSTQP